MENDMLVEQILERVRKKIEEKEALSEEAAGSCRTDAGRPSLVVLRQRRETDCSSILENQAIRSRFRVSCEIANDFQIDSKGIDVLVLCDMAHDTLSKIAAGFSCTNYVSLVQDALLTGKKIYLLRDQIDFLKYKETASPAYFQMMMARLKLLSDWGIVICSREELESRVLGACRSEICAEPEAGEVREWLPGERKEKEVTISKRVITERDIIEADREKVTCIHLRENNILTALAKDAADHRNIRLIRD